MTLDADGLLSVSERKKSSDSEPVVRSAANRKKEASQLASSVPSKKATPAATSKGAKGGYEDGRPAQKRSSTAKPIEWNDGSLPDSEYRDSDSEPRRRKLSKSERKRLRKQKAQQRRAA